MGQTYGIIIRNRHLMCDIGQKTDGVPKRAGFAYAAYVRRYSTNVDFYKLG